MNIFNLCGIVLYFLVVITGFSFVYKWFKENANKRIATLILVLILLRFLLIGFESFFGPLIPEADAQKYHHIGKEFAELLSQGKILNLFDKVNHIQIGYYIYVGLIYFITGIKNPILLKVLNVLIFSLSSIYGYKIARTLFSLQVAKTFIPLYYTLPTLFYFSAQNLKDSLIWFILLYLTNIFLESMKFQQKKIKIIFSISNAMIFLLFLAFLRTYALILLISSFLFYLFIEIVWNKKNNKIIIFSTIALFLVVGFTFVYFHFYGPDVKWNYFKKVNLKTLDDIRQSTCMGTLKYLEGWHVDNIQHLITTTIVTIPYTLFAPFPWWINRTIKMVPLLFEMFFLYFIYFYFIYGIGRIIKAKNKKALSILFFIFLWIITESIFQANAGTLIRQRDMILSFMIIISSYGIYSLDALTIRNFFDKKKYRATFFYPFIKRVFDLIGAILTILLLFPIFIIISILILIKDKPPIIYKGKRLGYKREEFYMYKFRTMKPEASAQEFVLSNNNHPLITDIGRILRRWSLDELPQLFNVIKGDMSLVGPRPLIMFYKNEDLGKGERRFDVPPGLTGWQQVSIRNRLDISFTEKEIRHNRKLLLRNLIEADLWYVDHKCFLLDVAIIFLTLRVVLTGEGLYISNEKK